jgi:hypothetical protein
MLRVSCVLGVLSFINSDSVLIIFMNASCYCEQVVRGNSIVQFEMVR